MTAAVAEKPKANGKGAPVLMPDRFIEEEQVANRWRVNAETGTSVEDLLRPEYWAHTAAKMTAYDEVRAIAEDGSWIAFLIVLFAEKTYAKVVCDRVITINENTTGLSSSVKHRVEFKGPHYKWSVLRAADNAILHNGFKTRSEAEVWMVNHEKAQ